MQITLNNIKQDKFINPDLDMAALRESIRGFLKYHIQNEMEIPVLSDALVIDNFLTPERRQMLEGQIYSHGTDLAKVYRTGRAGYGNNELSIAHADEQVPMLAELRRELDVFLTDLFGMELSSHTIQLRELAPKSTGHPRHVDYESGFDIIGNNGDSHAITSVSLSLILSMNGGKPPLFIMESPSGDVVQKQPGSLGIFGPQIYHSHPSTDELTTPSLWLVTQAFFKIRPSKTSEKPVHKTNSNKSSDGNGHNKHLPSDDARVDKESESPSLATWAQSFVQDSEALALLNESENRIRKAYTELLSGYTIDVSKILNEVVRVQNYDGLVIERDIDFTSICGHHFLPFFGKIDIAYEPDEIITGLGKLPRLAQAFSRRLHIQELLVKDIAEQIAKSIGARGVFVQARARHLCMHGRGPAAPNVETRCFYATGTLKQADRQQQLAVLLK